MQDSFKTNKNFGFLTNRVGRLLKSTVFKIAESKDINIPIHGLGILSDLQRKEGVLQQELAGSMIRNKSSITKMLERLEKDDFIRKDDDPEDARCKRIYLTEKGKGMNELLKHVIPDVHEIAFKDLSQSDKDVAIEVLNKIYHNLLEYNSNQSI